MGKPSDIFVVPSFELASAQRRAGGLAQQRAATTQTPRRPIGAGGVKGASRSGSASMITTRSLCAESPTQTEQWRCWLPPAIPQVGPLQWGWITGAKPPARKGTLPITEDGCGMGQVGRSARACQQPRPQRWGYSSEERAAAVCVLIQRARHIPGAVTASSRARYSCVLGFDPRSGPVPLWR